MTTRRDETPLLCSRGTEMSTSEWMAREKTRRNNYLNLLNMKKRKIEKMFL
jgi:hypothetical protein